MNKLTTIALLATVWLSSCNQNPFNKSLKGKKFYAITADTQSTRRVMANTPITFETITISEEEFYFSSDSILVITPTVVYININKEVFQIYLKQMESALSPREYRYSYKNGNLDIYEAGAQTITIEEHDNFYSTSTGETFYKHSIVGLTTDEKRERIAKIVTVKDDDMETLLKSELVLSNIAVQGDISSSREVKTNKDELLLSDAKKTKEETDKIINTNENVDTYVRLYNDQLIYKIENDIWPDDNLIQTALYITKNKHNQIIAFTEIPYDLSGERSVNMTHYFNKSGNTIITEKLYNTFYDGPQHPNFITGEIYKRSLVKYFDDDFNLIDQDYKITDVSDNLINVSEDKNLDIVGEYKDYITYSALLNDKGLNLKIAKVFVDADLDSPPSQIANISGDENIDSNIQYSEAEDIFKNPEIQPEPPKGLQAFTQWIDKNYQYPHDAIAANINGQLEVSFVVERDGSLTGFKITKDLGHGTADAAIDVLKKSPRWTPGIQNGRPVRTAYILPIKIHL